MDLQLKAQLRRTWSVFLARYGRFTDVQRRAVPLILAGHDTLVTAPTASGKTEAVLVPLIERYTPAAGLTLLYLCPTRALVRDLYGRIRRPLEELDIRVQMKTGDTGPVSLRRPPALLLTTPESTDALLTRIPRLFVRLRAVVFDEIHQFDAGPRGDHIRCLIRRLEYIRTYADPEQSALQCVALSATVTDPEGVAVRYLTQPVVISAPGGSSLEADIRPVDTLQDLRDVLGELQVPKSLVFCNTRKEVEEVAVFLRAHLSYEATVLVHYSNLNAVQRKTIETRFAEAAVAVCVSTSTLEMGIDIGSIDQVILFGAPFSLNAFEQRIGRTGRRTGTRRVVCLARSSLERIQFEALVRQVEHPESAVSAPTGTSFRPSVMVQQVFSLLKQSPTGGIRQADIRRIVPEEVQDGTVSRVLRHLAVEGYLKSGRPGEWRPGPLLDELVDAHEIYSNIGAGTLRMMLVDAFTGRTIAQTDRRREVGDVFYLNGRNMEVVWRDRYKMGLRPAPSHAIPTPDYTASAPLSLGFEVGQAIHRHLGIPEGRMPVLHEDEVTLLFHGWGGIYGRLLGSYLQACFADEMFAAETGVASSFVNWNDVCLELPFELVTLPPWDERLFRHVLKEEVKILTPFLEMGRFHDLLPPDVANAAVVDWLDPEYFRKLYEQASIQSGRSMREVLLELL